MSVATVQIVRLDDALPDDFAALKDEAAAEGYRFVDTLQDEWRDGRYHDGDERFALFAAYRDGELAAIGAITPDPYDPADDLLRIRHVYVRPLCRRDGIGRQLGAALVQQGLALAQKLSLNAADSGAAAFWETFGFRPDSGGTRRSHLLER